MYDIRTAEDIDDQLKFLRRRLEQLTAEGRITMSRDPRNTEHLESRMALSVAMKALDQAIHATNWMETIPALDGTYPQLPD